MKITLKHPQRRLVPRAFTLIEIMIVVGIIGLLAVTILPDLGKHQEHAKLKMIENNLRKIEAAKHLWALETMAAPDTTPTVNDLKPYGGHPKPLAGETYQINPVSIRPTAILAGKMGTHAAGTVISLPDE